MTYKDLEDFLVSNNMSAMDFSRKTGVSPQILTNAKKRGGHFSGQTVAKISNAITYKLSDSNENLFSLKQTLELQQLLSVPIHESGFELSADEIDLISQWRNADEESRKMIMRILAFSKQGGNTSID